MNANARLHSHVFSIVHWHSDSRSMAMYTMHSGTRQATSSYAFGCVCVCVLTRMEKKKKKGTTAANTNKYRTKSYEKTRTNIYC